MTAQPDDWLIPSFAGWTLADVEALPEKCSVEVFDGAPHVSPRPLRVHQRIARRLATALEPQLSAAWQLETEIDVVLSEEPLNYFSPDLVVFGDDVPLTAGPLLAKSVLLVVEVVSKGSRHMDRNAKPAVYAEAGIRHYWRVESPASLVPVVTVHTFALDAKSGVYASTGEHQDRFTAHLPEPVEIDPTALTL